MFFKLLKYWLVRYLFVQTLLDSGSQRAVVRRDLSEKINCPVLGRDELTVFTIGHPRRPLRYHCRRVSLDLRVQFNDTVITQEAPEVQDICTVANNSFDDGV